MSKPKQNKWKEKQPSTDQYMADLIQSFIANMIDDYSRISDMRNPIRPEMLPDDMPFEREVMFVIYNCEDRQIAPTRENIIFGLNILYGADPVHAESLVDDLITHQTQARDVSTLSNWVHEDFKRRQIEDALDKANAEMQNGEGTHSERLKRSVEILSNVQQDNDEDFILRTEDELSDHIIAEYRRRAEVRKSGRASGPNLKFSGFVGVRDEDGAWRPEYEGKIPTLRWGSSTLITGQPGSGKSVLAGMWAEHNAWELGYDVLLLHNETEQENLKDRQITRHTKIPTDYLLNVFNPENGENKAVKKVTEFLKLIQHYPAQTTYLYCPGWNVFRINAAIRQAAEKSAKYGNGLLVIMDYYNIIDKSNFDGQEHQQLGQVAYHLREGVKRANIRAQKAGGLGVHCIVFAQETKSEGNEASAFGSRVIMQVCQTHISIERKRAECDTPSKLKDFFGMPRYWSRIGQWSHVTTLNILKANYDQQGPVKVWVENAMALVHEAVGTVKQENKNKPPESLQSSQN